MVPDDYDAGVPLALVVCRRPIIVLLYGERWLPSASLFVSCFVFFDQDCGRMPDDHQRSRQAPVDHGVTTSGL